MATELTPYERLRAIRIARRAAYESQHSVFLTARIQYRRYIKTTTGTPMDWPEWRRHYRETPSPERPNDTLAPHEGTDFQ
ncbi:hypothetical protein [Gordonia sp. (in: high G+C Gram-positive bacteria)]|uniref:hypothetical protein n=1 Tax=unclassified Gordonia (in: high G+C Gram-positive bacteria) TaxID=2657482 RepID=UPI002605A90D|nr:hypothetical protein [Gordonia sp. (in: high G+C Gram-positive bacteria)]